MLIYTKRPEASAPALAIPEPPPLAVVKVEDLDKQHSEVVAAHKAKCAPLFCNPFAAPADATSSRSRRKAAVKADFEKARELKRSVYRNWDVVAEDVSRALAWSRLQLRTS